MNLNTDKFIKIGFNAIYEEDSVSFVKDDISITFELDTERFYYNGCELNTELLDAISDMCMQLGCK